MPIVLPEQNIPREEAWVDQPQSALPPHGFILFLERIGLVKATEIPHAYPEPITRERLDLADQKGWKEVQRVKTQYIDELISFRVSPPHRLGTPMKARAQQIIQTLRNGEIFGDHNTWLLDPLDRKSCLAVASYLIKKGHTNFWISGAMTGDFTDPLSNHKNQRMPIFGHDKNEYTPNHSPAKNLPELEEYLDCVVQFIHNERVEKLTRKIVRAKVPQFDHLLATAQRDYLAQQRPQAEAFIGMAEHIELNEGSDEGWNTINDYLSSVGQPPLDKHDHALIKLFPQDGAYWQNGDLRLEDDSLVLEFSSTQFTHREGAEKLENKPKFRFEIKRDSDGMPLIIADLHAQSFLPYLYPFLNSKGFWKRFDRQILPLLGNSPYHQVEFMYKIGYPAKKIAFTDLEAGMRVGFVDLIVDIISGIHSANSVESDQQFKNGDRNAKKSKIYPLISNIEPLTLAGAKICTPAEFDLLQEKNYISVLYHLLLDIAPAHHPLDSQQPKPSLSYEYDAREIAHALLKTQEFWNKDMVMPPSTLRILEDIIQRGGSSKSVSRALLMIENQARIAEIPEPVSQPQKQVAHFDISSAIMRWMKYLNIR